MTFQQYSQHILLSLLALAAGATAHAEALAPPALAALQIERGVVYREAPWLITSGGNGPYRFAAEAAKLPPGLRVDARGLLSGITCAAAGGFALGTVTVVDAAGASAADSLTATLHESGGACKLGVGGTWPAASLGQPFQATLVGSGGRAPYSFSVVGGQLPAGLTLQSSGTIAGTPSAAATHRFTVLVRDAQGATGVHEATLRVGAANRASASAYDSATAAARAQSSLAARGSVAHGYTAIPAAVPLDVARVRESASGSVDGEGAAATAARDVRPDPSTDASVAGLQSSEAEALKRLSAAQVRNVLARLEGDIDCRPEWQQQIELHTAWRDARPEGLQVEGPPAMAARPGCTSGLSGWAAGAVDYGRVPGAPGAAGSRFSSPGLSAGVDGAPWRGVRSGIALGHGQDRSEINGELGRIDSRSESVTAYGSWQAPLGVRVNAVLGQARTLLERQRSADAFVLQSQRRVTQRFGALAGSTRFDVGPWKLAPRVGVEHMSAALEAHAESDASALALGYDSARLAGSDLRGGLALSRLWRPALWTVEPELSVDWHRRLQGGMTQGLRYADDPLGTGYTLSSSEPSAEFAQLGVGVRMSHPLGWSVTLGARSQLDAGALRNAGYSAAMHWPF